MNINYRTVGHNCAVSVASLKLPITNDEALSILEKDGFKVLDISLISMARDCILKSKYRRGARPREAPAIVDCSSFVKWLYGKRGIWLPRRSIQQREFGVEIPLDEIESGDLVFVKGAFDWYRENPDDGVGHVGIATGEGTVVHASDSQVDVVESPLDRFIEKLKFRGVRRYIPNDHKIITLEIPPHREVETSDDIRWIILQSLPY